MTPFIIKEHGMKIGVPFINLYGWGDFHFGANAFCETIFHRDRQRIIDDPIARVILMGDPCDYIPYTDKRFDPECIDKRFRIKDLKKLPDIQTDIMADWLKPIADAGKIWGALNSNHSKKMEQRYHNDIHEKLCTKLNIPCWNYSAIGIIKCYEAGQARRKEDITIFAHHGFGGGRKKGAKVNRLDDIAGWFDFDIGLMAHVHDRILWENTKLAVVEKDGKPHIQQRERKCVITGTYLRTYNEGESGYGEQACYPPTPLGCKPVTIRWERFDNERVLVME